MRSIIRVLVAGFFALALADRAGAVQDPAKPDQPVPLSKALASDPRLASLAPAVRDKVLKEADAAKQYCATDGTLHDFYECDCFARKVFDRRLKVGTDVETMGSATRPASGEFKVRLAAILSDRELDSSPCVLPAEQLEKWARSRLVDPMMPEAKKACIARELAARFRKKPVADNAQALMRESIDACSGR